MNPNVSTKPLHRQYIETSLGKIHVAQAEGTGVPVVMWPSIFYDLSLYAGLCNCLSHPLLLIDGPGHGKSRLDRPKMTMADCAQILAELFNVLDIAEAIVIGTSWGGIVAAEFAIRYPESIRGTVLVNTPFAMPNSPELGTRLLVAATQFIPDWRVFKQGIARNFFAPTTQQSYPQVIEAFLTQPATFQNPGLHAAVKAVLMERSSLVPRLPRLQTPTLVIAGAEDPLYSVAEMQAAAAKIPDHEFEVVADSAHVSVVEQPDAIATLLHHFSSKL